MTHLTQPTISQLLAIWQEVIAPLHHKDRDCHFYISKHWRYSGDSDWEVTHHGYLLRDINETFPTYDAAESRLREVLIEGIVKWMDHEDDPIMAKRRAEILTQTKSFM